MTFTPTLIIAFFPSIRKNHTTGGYAKSIYYLKDDAPSSLSAAPENLLKAQFVFVPKKKSDDKKKDPAKPPKNINVYVSETSLEGAQQRKCS